MDNFDVFLKCKIKCNNFAEISLGDENRRGWKKIVQCPDMCVVGRVITGQFSSFLKFLGNGQLTGFYTRA